MDVHILNSYAKGAVNVSDFFTLKFTLKRKKKVGAGGTRNCKPQKVGAGGIYFLLEYIRSVCISAAPIPSLLAQGFLKAFSVPLL